MDGVCLFCVFRAHTNWAASDTRWAHRVNDLREVELAWRVKEAIVGPCLVFYCDPSV